MQPRIAFPSRPLPRLIAVIGLLAICLGASSRSCSLGNIGDDDDDDNGGGGGNNEEPSFVTTLELRNSDGEIADQFDRGESIQMTLTVRNRLNSAVQVDFTTTRTSDFIVVEENTDDVVWQWSDDEGPFSDIETTLDFAAGEIRTFTVTWDQEGDNDNQVRADTYEARGVLLYEDFDSNPLRTNQLGSTLVRFTID